MDSTGNPECALTIVDFGVEDLIFSANYDIRDIWESRECMGVELRHLQVKQLECAIQGCLVRYAQNLCIQQISTKNIYILRLPAFRNSKSLRDIKTH